jgi:LuxR family maltose regulon positive regulatory protein
MPKGVVYRLLWSSTSLSYELQSQQGSVVLSMKHESPAWFAWLAQGISFAFVSRIDSRSYIIRKEMKQRGNGYWYAYQRDGQKLTKKYLGKAAAVTPARLEDVAILLNTHRGGLPSTQEKPLQQGVSPVNALASVPIASMEEDTDRPSPPSVIPNWPRDPLLATKLHVPRQRSQFVHRPHLIERLRQGREEARLTLLSAPAGSGKTMLLTDWLVSSGMRVAWLSLGAEENEPTRFLSYVIAALQTLDPSIGTVALAMLHTPQPAPLEQVLAVLLNDLMDPDLGDFTLVLDDYHVITAEPLHRTLTYLVEHLPPQMHLLIATRTNPPLPLAHLRARNQLTELRAADFQFGLSEVSAFLHLVMGLDLPPDVIETLRNRTEGWIAGVQLAALSLRGRADVSEFLTTFTGSHHFVLDYLSEEVLARQPRSVQTFLLSTCVLNTFSSELCEAVTGQTQGQAMLERLERTNLFLISLDDERRWYRYHHLFAEMLRSHLQKNQPALMPELHRRASTWYEQHGYEAEAVGHALAAHDSERVAQLIEPLAQTMLEHGDIATLQRWMDALSPDVVRSHSRLFLADAWLLLLTGQIDAAEMHLRDAQGVFTVSYNGKSSLITQKETGEKPLPRNRQMEADRVMREEFRGEVAAITATIALARNDLQQAIDWCLQALQYLPRATSHVQGQLALLLGQAYRMKGDLVAAERALAEASMQGQAASNLFLTLGAMLNLAELHELQGQLHEAVSIRRQVVGLAITRDGRPLPVAGPAYIGLGKVLREWNDLDTATEYLTKGSKLSQQGGLESNVFDAMITLALVAQAQQHSEGAFTLLQQAHSFAQRAKSIWAINRIEAFRARLYLMQGNIDAALRWLQQSGLQSDDPVNDRLETDYLTVVRVLLAYGRTSADKGHLTQARALLGQLLKAAERAERRGSLIEILALQALALHAQDETIAALAALKRALSLAEPQGYIRLFVDEGEPMTLLLKGLLAHHRTARRPEYPGFSRQYLHTLLDATGQTTTPSMKNASVSPGVSPLLDPLSERELEVLRLLAAGYKNQEIADKLVVVLGTVKTHLQSLYRKLEVNGRVQAVSRAKTLKLL